ncbi:DNA cytosine methyltransferase [Hymenobacter endophyticus]|uniref:DNA (cytosine-5-)-methyltransferase n=1 Tax=Hymenobacter endophyticus TaxID=3076335 RepID=A0ABU3TKX0_9BACT|nr:DNA cytosine methyltransferase [Hymenobacter endophyticus]MDU0372021.1 DNA cytosine methyltransferase [Hymenobacter endophyticus]
MKTLTISHLKGLEAAAQLLRAGFRLRLHDHYGGCGGGSLGLKRAGGYDVAAMLNHNATCVATHKVNNPTTRHFCADVRATNEFDLGRADIIWASPSCTHHSIARGGMSCDEQERALPEELPRFALAADAKCLMIENVKEFRNWGPTEPKRDKQGRIVYRKGADGQPEPVYVPVKSRKGEYYRRWVATLKGMGYVNYECRLLDAANYGTPQSRVRYFGIFTRAGIPISWPAATHDRHGKGGLPRWNGVEQCLDLDDTGHSIFTRRQRGKKDYADATLSRLLAGIRKLLLPTARQVQGSDLFAEGIQEDSHCRPRTLQQFLYQNNGTRAGDKAARSVRPVCRYSPTVTTNGGNLFLASVKLLTTYYKHGAVKRTSDACPTLRTKDCAAMATVHLDGFTFSHQFSNTPRLLREPARTVVASRRHQYLALIRRGPCHLAPAEGDSLVMRLLKFVCRKYGIADILLRMLKVPELKRIMGFPEDYQLLGTQTEQKAMLGNAVCPQVAEALGRAMLPALLLSGRRKRPPLRHQVVERWEQGELFSQDNYRVDSR